MQKHIVILGAGISGLSLAWFLKKAYADKIRLTILEKSPRTGGWMQSIRKKGFFFELGPHSFRSKGNGTVTLQLIEELGLANNVIVPDAAAGKRYVLHNKRLHLLPSNPLAFLLSPLTRGCMGALLREISKPPEELDDESIDAFIRRRFNSHTASVLVDPLASGIYAGDSKKLSMRACFPELFYYEQRYGSILKGLCLHKRKKETLSPFVRGIQKHGLFSLDNGTSVLTNRLSDMFANAITYDAADALSICKDHIDVSAGSRCISADHVYSTIPAYAFSKLLQPIDHPLASKLNAIEYASIVAINVGFSQSVLKPKGFGYLVPSSENERILGVIWDSSIFPHHNLHPDQVRLTVMMGGARHPDIISLDNNALLSIALETLERHMGIKAQPDFCHIARVPQAIPQYTVGHINAVESIKFRLRQVSPRITWAGTAVSGVSINDCIAHAKRLQFHSDGHF